MQTWNIQGVLIYICVRYRYNLRVSYGNFFVYEFLFVCFNAVHFKLCEAIKNQLGISAQAQLLLNCVTNGLLQAYQVNLILQFPTLQIFLAKKKTEVIHNLK